VLALVFSVAGVVFLMLGAGRLYAPSLQGRQALLLPTGVLVYIAVPPARDFATSGLENGLVLAYLGLLWWMMVCWSQALRAYPDEVTERNAVSVFFDGTLALVAGLSVLVRPELALMGGLALVMMLIAARGWRRRVLIVVAGGLLPVAYQIFRMGYYGLLVPGTALAKDASGKKWAQGWVYLENFNRPYLLWLPVILLAVLGVLVLAGRSRPWWIREARWGHRPPEGRGTVGDAWPGWCRARPLSRCTSFSAGCCRPPTGSARAATSCTAGFCWRRCSACWPRLP